MTNYWPIIPTTSWLEVDTHREAGRQGEGGEGECVCERERAISVADTIKAATE